MVMALKLIISAGIVIQILLEWWLPSDARAFGHQAPPRWLRIGSLRGGGELRRSQQNLAKLALPSSALPHQGSRALRPGCFWAKQGTQKPKKTSPPQKWEEVLAWGHGGEAAESAIETIRKRHGPKLKAYGCGRTQVAVIEAPTDLLSLMRFLSLRLKPKAAAAPRAGRGAGAGASSAWAQR